MPRVLVAGSANMDIVARVEQHPRIGETIHGSELGFFPGGKGANVAIAAAKLGAPSFLIGKLGQDAFGDELSAFLGAQGVDLAFLRRSPRARTGTALIVVSESAENSIVVIPGANRHLTEADLEEVPIEKGDILVSQLEIPPATIERFFTMGRKAGARTILNATRERSRPTHLFALSDILVMNETELAFFAGSSAGTASAPSLSAAAKKLRTHPAQAVIITLGSRGAFALVDGKELMIVGHPVKAVDSTGAGDCFIGALAARFAAGDAIAPALVYANKAASICVQRRGAGTSMPTAAEVEQP